MIDYHNFKKLQKHKEKISKVNKNSRFIFQINNKVM